ncbi:MULTISPECIES: hypothetical protein [Streptomyces]|uniref:hypothetical protein n=2 Tax=Streptomyces TaxID=1883 RepID=UPI0033C705B8
MLEVSPGHPSFVGTPSSVADEWTRYVRTRAVDGFNLLPHLLPASVTDIVDTLVPALQERGVYRTAYQGTPCANTSAFPPRGENGRALRGPAPVGGGTRAGLRRPGFPGEWSGNPGGRPARASVRGGLREPP